MDGTEVLRALRTDPPTAALPVVLLTGAPEQDTPGLLDLGATAVLHKPFDPDTVVAQLLALL
jgi:CheY-like chemotaxis protein